MVQLTAWPVANRSLTEPGTNISAPRGRHRDLRLRIDSHTGVGAPPQVHASHSVQRAAVVSQRLVSSGVAADRISACAWGYRVGQHRNWPATREFARVEVFVENGRGSGGLFDRSRCLPAWPSYFESVTPVKEHFTFAEDGAMVAGDAGLGDSESDGEEGGEFGGGLMMQLMMQLQGVAPAHPVLEMIIGNTVSSSSEDDGSSDDEDGGAQEEDDVVDSEEEAGHSE